MQRFDAWKIDGMHKTPEGFLVADAYATRAGVFTYNFKDGTKRRELRRPEEVFHPDSLATLQNSVLTNDHPSEAVTSKNARKYAVGFTGQSVDRDDNKVKITTRFTDQSAIDAIESGEKAELSCGYHCDVVMGGGQYMGEEYDAEQKNIRYNHVALVKVGRAGPDVRIRMDSEDGIICDEGKTSEAEKSKVQSTKGDIMAKITIDSVDLEVSETAAVAIQNKFSKLQSEKNDAESATQSLQKKLDEASVKAETLSAEIENKKTEIEKLKADTLTEKQILEKADALAKVRTLAKELLPEGTKIDEMEISAIKREVVKSRGVTVDGKDDSAIAVAFETIQALNLKKDSTKDLSDKISGMASVVTTDSASPANARLKLMEDSKKMQPSLTA